MPRDFDEIYPTNDKHERFDYRNNAFGRAARAGQTGYSDPEKKAERIRKNVPGFSLVDYAFSGGALTVAQASHSGRGNQNSGFYSWTPLGVTIFPDGVDKWSGSPNEASRLVRKSGKYYGATEIGFTKLDKRWVYSKGSDGKPIVFEDVEAPYATDEKSVIPESCKYVIAITVPMEVDEMMYAPAAMNPTSSMGYSRMPAVAGSLAEFIRGLGYNAVPCGNDTASSIPIAIQAGLGHVGRHGRLITWEDGPMVRIAKIFTDLPLEQTPMADEGIIQFCEDCEKCAKLCPSQSIPYGPRTYEGYSEANNDGALKWYCNADTCLEYWREIGSGCSICFRVCNFTKEKGPSHDIVKWFIKNAPFLNKFFVWSDELLGYGSMKDPRKYWDKPLKSD
jgi:reductive dehalogenase